VGDFDLLAITGDASLGGELSVARLAGYTPALGDSFVVMTFTGSGSGEFAVESFHGFGTGVVLSVLYNDHNVTLGVTAVPEPTTWVMILAGLGLVIGVAQRRRRASGRLPD
jgi:hypothetical protein